MLDLSTRQLVLLVEDNADDEALTVRAFRKSKISNELVVARDGIEALDFLFGTGTHEGRDTSIEPQFVLLDLKLPKLDGLEVLARVRSDSRTRHIPVVVLTSSDEQRDLVESYDLGVNSYVRKPVDFAQFTSTVEDLGTYWLVLNQLPHAT